METFPDLGALTDQELKELIQELTEEEQELSDRRRILHGKIDILRAELVNRLRKKHEVGEPVITGSPTSCFLRSLLTSSARRMSILPCRMRRRSDSSCSSSVSSWISSLSS